MCSLSSTCATPGFPNPEREPCVLVYQYDKISCMHASVHPDPSNEGNLKNVMQPEKVQIVKLEP